MSLFQKSVVNKYLKNLDRQVLIDKWNAYKNHFLNPSVQVGIRNLKEEQYQGEFLDDLFVKILGYTKPASSSETKFNLTTEYKNVKDSKKADGAIIFDDKAIAVIELKGTNTTDLGKIEAQAFGYKNNQPDCVYVITSNFEKLRFYIDNAIEHIEFNLFTLTEEEFKLLYLCLGFDNLSQNIAKKIKDESLSEEDVITKKLYKDYSLFKRELHQNLVLLNPNFEPLELFKKSQKLLDRFLFLFFGEDRHLLPPNSVRLILSDWKDLIERDVDLPLYDRFKTYFKYLNEGHKGKRYDVFAYNGGLFKPDEILDSISIDDDLLYKHTIKLAEYDFASEVDVNILGHIFENSLNELDEIKGQLEGQEIDKSKSKRKKDGVFYTPKYITKYIVENTVGKLCQDKKLELEIIEEEYFADKKRQKKTIQGLVEKLDTYRKWLLGLTICDPACGSGAFLNQALDFLIEEHQYIDELQAKLFGDALIMSDMENSILENNLFGVDLNEESVEIAKLSLWLRTAQPNRKLNDLNGNIKCGNSLIDDETVAGVKAFNWQKAFPKVFEKGGFDVIIGNPPYVNVELMPTADKLYYNEEYKSFFKRADLFSLFFELAFSKLSRQGRISFIVPSVILNNLSYKLLRKEILNNQWLTEVCYTGGKVFDDATVDTVILTLNTQFKNQSIILKNSINFFNPNIQIVNFDFFEKYGNNISVGSGDANNITDKLFRSDFLISQDFFQIFQGTVTGNNEAYIFDNLEDALANGIDSDLLKTMCHGRDIGKWLIKDTRKLCYVDNTTKIENYKNTLNWLTKFKDVLETRRECKNGVIPWYSLQWPRERTSFQIKPKILIQNTRNEILQPRIVATIDNDGLFGTQGLNFIIQTGDVDIYCFLAILNSNLINYLFSTKFLNLAIKADYLKKIMFPKEIKHSELSLLAIKMSNNTIELQEQSQKFQRTIQRKFELEELPKKLQDWYKLPYTEFIKELAKKKVKLSLSQESEWEDYFMQESKKALELKATIDGTDKAIDTMVYELYGLSEEEIEIVENS